MADSAVPAVRLLSVAFFAFALVFAAVAWVLDDVFFFRLATEALIFGGWRSASTCCWAAPACCRWGRRCSSASVPMSRPWCSSTWHRRCRWRWGIVLLSSTLVGLVGGVIAIRAKGVYFALISFGLAQVVSKVVFNTRELGASDGLIGVPAPVWLGLHTAHAPSFFLLVLLGMAALLAFLLWLMNTPFGRQLDAIRTNEDRLPFLGFDPWRYKLAVFVLAAQVAALSGALYPMLRGFVSPN